MHMKEADAFDTLRFILYTLQVRMQYKPDMQKLQVNKHYPGSYFGESVNSNRWQKLKALCQAGDFVQFYQFFARIRHAIERSPRNYF